MTPTKFLIGQIAIVFAVVIGGLWLATEWAAFHLGYQPRLGPIWFWLGNLAVYYPWRLFEWWYAYDAYAPTLFNRAGMIAGSSAFFGVLVAIIGSLWRARQSRLVTTYGSSRWAEMADIASAGLFRPAGIFLGQLNGRYLRHQGAEHAIAVAPTRQGKGVGLIIPTLLSWPSSTVVHDIKGENWQLTAGWRARFSHCLLFNPTDARSARYNPLLEVRKGPNEVRDVQNIADILVDPEGALEKRSHWEKTSHSLLVGVILHVLYAEEEKTLARVAGFLSDPQRSFQHTLRKMMETNHLGSKEQPLVHPVVASAARELLNKSENGRRRLVQVPSLLKFLGVDSGK
jgi:type IV secretion system protein VirD4